MFQTFIPKNFSAAHSAIIDSANDVIRKYQGEGYDLTLRQLYYQFVALNLFPDEWLVKLTGGQLTKNHERNYKKLGGILNDARLAGHVDWDAIVDRTRSLNEWQHETSVADALQRMKRNYTLDMWDNQPIRVEVWVEKEALAGVFNRICAEYDVPYFACRGYTSASSSYAAYQRVVERVERDQKTLILHFGDHDPSGLDMTRDIEDRLRTMVESEEYGGSDYDNCFEIRRLALSHAQVLEFDPPPSPAKITDSRAKGYMETYGDDSWELDALEPTKLADLAKVEIESVIDYELWEETEERIKEDRKLIQKFIDQSNR